MRQAGDHVLVRHRDSAKWLFGFDMTRNAAAVFDRRTCRIYLGPLSEKRAAQAVPSTCAAPLPRFWTEREGGRRCADRRASGAFAAADFPCLIVLFHLPLCCCCTRPGMLRL